MSIGRTLETPVSLCKSLPVVTRRLTTFNRPSCNVTMTSGAAQSEGNLEIELLVCNEACTDLGLTCLSSNQDSLIIAVIVVGIVGVVLGIFIVVLIRRRRSRKVIISNALGYQCGRFYRIYQQTTTGTQPVKSSESRQTCRPKYGLGLNLRCSRSI